MLLIPQRFKDVDISFRCCRLVHLLQNFRYLVKAKAVKELAHPYCIRCRRKFCRCVKNITRAETYPVCKTCGGGIFFRNGSLSRKVNNSHLYVRIVAAAGNRPFCRISAYIYHSTRFFCKNNRKRLRKGNVAVKMVKFEPGFFCLFRKRRKRLVDSRPLVTEYFKTFRLSVLHGSR